jgi:hypothetical protein
MDQSNQSANEGSSNQHSQNTEAEMVRAIGAEFAGTYEQGRAKAAADTAVCEQARAEEAADAAEAAQERSKGAVDAAVVAQGRAKAAADVAVGEQARAEEAADAVEAEQERSKGASDAAEVEQERAKASADIAVGEQARAEEAADAAEAEQERSKGAADAAEVEQGRAKAAADVAVGEQARAEEAADAAEAEQEKSKGAADAAVVENGRAKFAADTALGDRGRAKQAADTADQKLQDLNRTLENSITATLGGAFQKKSEDSRTLDKFWLGVLIIGILGMFLIGAIRYSATENLIGQKAEISYIAFQLLINLASMSGPIWLSWVATLRLARTHAITEDYSYKAALAQAYQGYSTSVADEDEFLKYRLFATVITQLDASPVRFVSEKHPATPFQDLLQQPWMEQVLKDETFKGQFVEWLKSKFNTPFKTKSQTKGV